MEFPPEILIHIFSFLNLYELLKASGICRYWCNIINNYVFKDRVIIRYKGQRLPSRYSTLHVALPMKRKEFMDLIQKSIKEVELRWDGIGDTGWDEKQLDYIIGSLPRISSLEGVNLDGLILNKKMINHFDKFKPRQISLRVISEVDSGNIGIFWSKRELFKEIVLLQNRILSGYFHNSPSIIAKTLLRNVHPTSLQLQGKFSGQLLTQCHNSLSCLQNLVLENLYEEDASNLMDVLSTLPLLNKLSMSYCQLSEDLGVFRRFPSIDKIRFIDYRKSFNEMTPLLFIPLSSLVLGAKCLDYPGFFATRSIKSYGLDIIMRFKNHDIKSLLSYLQSTLTCSLSFLGLHIVGTSSESNYNVKSIAKLKTFCEANGIELKFDYDFGFYDVYCILTNNIDTLFFI